MATAGALSCPKCGATADPDATRCEFCKARLATVACPKCFSRFFRGFSNCPYCGAEAERESLEASDLHCPKCEAKPKLVKVRIGETLVDECGTCAGFWLGHKTFERLQENKEEHAAVLGMPAPVVASHAEVIRYVPCPSCGNLMNRVNFAHCSGVVIDTCKEDGIWFDADELRRIIAFIESGGLAKARDRELDRLRTEQQALKSTMRQLESERMIDAQYHGHSQGGYGPGLGDMVGAIGSLIGSLFNR